MTSSRKPSSMSRRLQESIPIQQMTRQEQAAINKVMMDAVEVYQAAGREAPAAMWEIIVATQDLNEANESHRPVAGGLEDVVAEAADTPGAETSRTRREAAQRERV